MITKIQLTAMERAHIPEEKRTDFYLYVDEFQNFATEAFATILSEARKYHLNIILANQYIAQMPEEVRDAVFGNIGTIISFRVGAQDAPFLAKEYAPVFEENDLVNLDKYNIYIKMSIDGVTCPAFSAITLPPNPHVNQNKEKIVRLSREKYSKPRHFVEEKITQWVKEVGGMTVAQGIKGVKGEEIKVGEEIFESFVDQKKKKWYMLVRKEEKGIKGLRGKERKEEKVEVKANSGNPKPEKNPSQKLKPLKEGEIVEFK